MAARQTNLMKHAPFPLGVLLCAAPFALYPPDGWGFPDSAAFGVFFILSWTSFTIWYWTIWSSWVMLARGRGHLRRLLHVCFRDACDMAASDCLGDCILRRSLP